MDPPPPLLNPQIYQYYNSQPPLHAKSQAPCQPPPYEGQPQFPYRQSFMATLLNPHFFLGQAQCLFPQSSQATPSQTAPQQAMPKVQEKVRPPNWTMEEDEALCRAYVKVSEDSATGTDQRRMRLWDRTLVEFIKELGHDSNRESSGLSNRWGTIRGEINKYSECVEMIKRNPPSGFNSEDLVGAINRLFFKKHECHFKFDPCWQILKKSSSWIWNGQKQGKEKKKHKGKKVLRSIVDIDSPRAQSNLSTAASTPHSASPAVDGPASTPHLSTTRLIVLDDDGAPFPDQPLQNEPVRPPGQKAAKGKRGKKRSIYANYGSVVADKIKEGLAILSRDMENKIEQELNARAEEIRIKMEEKRFRRETDIMLTNVNSMESEDQKIWLATEQKRIAARRRDLSQT